MTNFLNEKYIVFSSLVGKHLGLENPLKRCCKLHAPVINLDLIYSIYAINTTHKSYHHTWKLYFFMSQLGKLWRILTLLQDVKLRILGSKFDLSPA